MAVDETGKPIDERKSGETQTDGDKAAPDAPAGKGETKQDAKPDDSTARKKSEPLQAFELARNFLLAAAGVGVFLAVLFALQAQTGVEKASIAAFGVGMIAAAMSAGGLLGFVFGIPTSLQDRHAPVAPTNGTSDDIPALYVGNTSLEQISDWLTKILVGVGLTQLASIPSGLAQVGDFLAGGLGDLPGADVFATVMVVFALVDGFFLGYLWTRLNLPYLLAESDFKQRLATARDEARVEGEKKALDAVASAPDNAPASTAPTLDVPGDVRPEVEKGAPSDEGAEAEPGAEEQPGVEAEGVETPAIGSTPIASPATAAGTAAAPSLIGLWVDDHPENNVSVMKLSEFRYRVAFETARNTDEAIDKLTANPGRYSFVITDMGRPGDRRAGFTLLSRMRERNLSLPTIIYAASANPDQQVEAVRLGAEALTNSPTEVLQIIGGLVTRIRMVPRG